VKLLSVAVPLVGAGPAPPYTPSAPPLVVPPPLLARCLKCLALLGCPFFFGSYFLPLYFEAL